MSHFGKTRAFDDDESFQWNAERLLEAAKRNGPDSVYNPVINEAEFLETAKILDDPAKIDKPGLERMDALCHGKRFTGKHRMTVDQLLAQNPVVPPSALKPDTDHDVSDTPAPAAMTRRVQEGNAKRAYTRQQQPDTTLSVRESLSLLVTQGIPRQGHSLPLTEDEQCAQSELRRLKHEMELRMIRDRLDSWNEEMERQRELARLEYENKKARLLKEKRDIDFVVGDD